jgi:hypothetical protein
LISYLHAKGWRETQREADRSYWGKEITGGSFEIFVPMDPSVRDFAARIAEALSALEESEGRSQIEIIEDLTYRNADIIRPRFVGASEDGSITLEQGRLLHESARDLMLAAACGAIEHRAVHARRKPDLAMEYLNRARFGLARRGSYIMTIISPVPPRLVAETDLFGAVINEPFERQAVKTLVVGLAALNNACRAFAADGNFEPMAASVAQGVSANFCEALVGMHAGGGNRGISFSVGWSPSRSAPSGLGAHVDILPDAMPIIQEAARVFRATESVENIEVVGTVQRLQHEGGQQGDVTVFGIADGQQRTVHILLSGSEHRQAVAAYESRAPIACVGKLVRDGRSMRLMNPRDFRILPELV